MADDGSRDRKAEHITLALDDAMQLHQRAFDQYELEHRALPEVDLDAVRTATSFVGRPLRAPVLISCMTGGTAQARTINRRLAEAAQVRGLALGLGSMRKLIEDPTTLETFEVRDLAPDIPLLANLGAVQLRYGYGIDEARRLVDAVEADALVLHLNPLQEALQPEGQCDFGELAPRIAALVRSLDVPVVVKEVGSGLSHADGVRLQEAGVALLDLAGTGGTSWARIEAARAADHALGEVFADWGLTTPDSLLALRDLDGVELVASGGIRNGLDGAKSLALGARWFGLAQPFLQAAVTSTEAVVKVADRVVRELRIAMFCSGCVDLDALGRATVSTRLPPWRSVGRSG